MGICLATRFFQEEGDHALLVVSGEGVVEPLAILGAEETERAVDGWDFSEVGTKAELLLRHDASNMAAPLFENFIVV
jgi:hypothetical protein